MSPENHSLLRRLAIYYFLSYGALGWFFPQLPILLQRKVGAAWVGVVMMAYPVFGLVVSPFWGLAADRYRAGVRLLVGSTVLMAPTVLLYSGSEAVASLLAITALVAVLRAPQPSLADALTHVGLEGDHHRFSRFRIWGSVGFVALAAISGALGGVDAGLTYLVVPAILYLLAAGALVGVVEPAKLAPRAGVGREALRLLREPAMWRALLGLCVYYSAHSLFDAYFGLHVAALGMPAGHASLAWSFGALVEIGVMVVAPRLLARVAGRRLLAPVALVAALRWYLTSVLRHPAALIAVQGLHGFSFGLWYLSIVNHFQAVAPAALRASVQGAMMAAWGLAGVIGYGLGGALVATGPTALLYRWGALIALASAGIFLLVPATGSERQRP